MNLVLYRKWRPQTWDDVVGQKHVIQTLAQAVASGRTAHAYLFSGPRGTGKTSMARILAKAVNCLAEDPAARPCNECAHCRAINGGTFMDLIEIDAASNTSVEDIRDLRERVLFSPAEGRFKVYIIDEVHMLSTAAFNALLKTLEEPPAHVLFVLATTEVHKIPATVISRCQRHEFRRLGVEEMVIHLEQMAKEEGLQVERAALETVARQATGSMRDAVSLLDQLGSLGEVITMQRTLEVLGAAGNESVHQLATCIAAGDAAGGLKILHDVMDSGADARQFARQMVDFLRGVMMAGSGNADLVEATAETRMNMKTLAEKLEPAALVRAIRAFSLAASDSRTGWRPQLPLELALMDAILTPSIPERGSPIEPPGGRTGVGASKPAPGSSADKGSPPSPQKPPAGMRPSSTNPALRPVQFSPAAETNPAAGLTLGRIMESWNRIMSGLRERDSRTHALFSASQVRSLDGDILSLTVPSDLIQQKCSRLETQTMLQGVLAEVLGVPVRIRCVVGVVSESSGLGTTPGGSQFVKGGMMDIATSELGAHVIDLP
jgi:DNA polymerase-3 subunit gamma/tau